MLCVCTIPVWGYTPFPGGVWPVQVPLCDTDLCFSGGQRAGQLGTTPAVLPLTHSGVLGGQEATLALQKPKFS